MLAYKLYEPECTELEDELFDELKILLTTFASEFYLATVDDFTIEDILETMDNHYCS